MYARSVAFALWRRNADRLVPDTDTPYSRLFFFSFYCISARFTAAYGDSTSSEQSTIQLIYVKPPSYPTALEVQSVVLVGDNGCKQHHCKRPREGDPRRHVQRAGAVDGAKQEPNKRSKHVAIEGS